MDEAALHRRLGAIEEQLELLSNAANVPYSRPGGDSSGVLPEEVALLIQRGDTLNAIRLLRELRGLSLADAKSAVDDYR